MHPDLEQIATAYAADRQIATLRRKRTTAEATLADGKKAAADAQKARDAAQAELRRLGSEEQSLAAKTTEYQARKAGAQRVLDTGGNLDVAQRQLDQVNAILDDVETQGILNLEAQDAARVAVALADKALAERRKVEADVVERIPKEIAAIDAEISRHEAERVAALAPLDHNTRERYMLLLAKKGSAASEVKGGVCAACSMAVQPQHLADVKRGMIVPCRGCSRWLIAI